VYNFPVSKTVDPLVHQITDEEVSDKAKEIFESMKEHTGEVPKWMRVMANCEDVFVGFFSLFKATMDDAPVDKELKWKLAYFVSELNKCEYCVSVTLARLKGFGIEKEDVENLKGVSGEKELAALAYAEAATTHAFDVDQKTFDNLKKHFSDAEIVELTAVIGLFNFINRFNDALGVFPDIA